MTSQIVRGLVEKLATLGCDVQTLASCLDALARVKATEITCRDLAVHLRELQGITMEMAREIENLTWYLTDLAERSASE